MSCLPTLSRAALAAASLGFFVLAVPVHAEVAVDKPAAPPASAAEACERAARQSLAGRGLRPAEVTFNGAPTLQPSLSNESLTVLRGVVRWKGEEGVRSISYSCNVDRRTAEMVGLVMRDITPAAAEAAPARAGGEPDLSQLSPAACESGAAEALKQRWPRVSQIAFDPATRTFEQQSANHAEFHGSGRALPTPSSPSTFFRFDCQIDPRDGRVLRTNVAS